MNSESPRLTEGRIEMHNNWVKNGMRAIALGRKNRLHIVSAGLEPSWLPPRLLWRHANRRRFALKSISDLYSALLGLNSVLTRAVADLTPLTPLTPLASKGR